MLDITIATALGSATVSAALENIDQKTLVDIARKIVSGNLIEDDKDLKSIIKNAETQEVGPLVAVALGFAAGAAARIAGKEKNMSEAATDEIFPVVVQVFIAGAVAGAKAVDGFK